MGDPTFGFDVDQGAIGGLFGGASIINVAEGTMFSYNATALDAFWTAGQTNHTNPGSLLPSLLSGDNTTSNVFVNGTVESINWTAGTPLAVNATLTLAELMNEYTLNAAVGGRTEWVLTFPTKRFHVDTAPGGSPLLAPVTMRFRRSPPRGPLPSRTPAISRRSCSGIVKKPFRPPIRAIRAT